MTLAAWITTSNQVVSSAGFRIVVLDQSNTGSTATHRRTFITNANIDVLVGIAMTERALWAMHGEHLPFGRSAEVAARQRRARSTCGSQ